MHLPHVTPYAAQPIYFFTACTKDRNPVLACDVVHHILRDLWRSNAHQDGWYVGRYTIMPDHVHFFARPSITAKPLAVWTKAWKSIGSRRIKEMVSFRGPIWQPETFDRILRSSTSYGEKWNYVSENPVRAKLVEQPSQWRWQGEVFTLEF